jgi:hypothetical protein
MRHVRAALVELLEQQLGHLRELDHAADHPVLPDAQLVDLKSPAAEDAAAPRHSPVSLGGSGSAAVLVDVWGGRDPLPGDDRRHVSGVDAVQVQMLMHRRLLDLGPLASWASRWSARACSTEVAVTGRASASAASQASSYGVAW